MLTQVYTTCTCTTFYHKCVLNTSLAAALHSHIILWSSYTVAGMDWQTWLVNLNCWTDMYKLTLCTLAHAHLSCGRKLLAPIWHCTVQASDAAVATRTDIQFPLCPFLMVYNPLNIEDHSMATNVPRPPFQSSNCLWHFMQKNHHLVSPLLLNRLSTHTHASDNRDVSNTWPAITWWAGVEHRYKHHSFLSQTGSCMFSCR